MLIPLLSTQNFNQIFATGSKLKNSNFCHNICISLLLILPEDIYINQGPLSIFHVVLASKKLKNLPTVFAAITVIYGFTSHVLICLLLLSIIIV